MARVLVINPGMDIAAGFGDYAGLMEPMPPIGVAYLAAACRRAGHDTLLLDNFVAGRSPRDVAGLAREWGADVVGLSMLTPTARATAALAQTIRDQAPHARIVLGNLHASLFAEQLLAEDCCDAVVHGEGETVFPQLVAALAAGLAPDGLPGVSYRRNGGATTNPPAPHLEDLDTLPWPAWELLPWRRYTFLPFVTVARPCLALLGTRGCPYRCKFCALGYQGKKHRARRPAEIAAEADWLSRAFGVRHIGFVDPIFPYHKAHGLAVCEAFVARGVPDRAAWTSETRVDMVDDELCRAMKRAGCRRILFGVESGDNGVLRGVGKNFTVATVREAVATARRAGLEITAFFMLGLPGETAQITRRTIEFARELDIDFAKFGLTVPLPGSALYDELERDGKIPPDAWERFFTFQVDPTQLPYVPAGLTAAALLRLHRRATWRFYMRPKMVFRHLFRIRSIGLPMLVRGARILFGQRLRGKF
jgi:radical SAM superfamily enzyme YgiQ (UPF0313 family)